MNKLVTLLGLSLLVVLLACSDDETKTTTSRG